MSTLPERSKPTMANKQIHDNVQKILDEATSDSQKVPGAVFAAVGKDGNLITFNASGTRALGGKKPMDEDTVFWIASFTKLMTAIVCMQLVEQGKVKLDDAEHLYEYCPELKTIKVLEADGSLVERKKDITLRMLLSHTAGFGYDFFNKGLRDHTGPSGMNILDYYMDDYVNQPLVNQPGSKWEYGLNIDWAGFYCERASGTRLNDLMQQGIVKPLGLKDTNMFPTESMKANLASLHQHYPGSPELHVVEHMVRGPLRSNSKKLRDEMVQSGGAGMFSKPTEYLQILAMLLNDGVAPKTGERVLKAESVKDMFTNQIKDKPDWAAKGPDSAKPLWTNPVPTLALSPGQQGWGLSMQLVEDGIEGGRSPGSGNWAGIANCFYFVDRAKGVAALINSQILPFFDMSVIGPFIQCEQALYAGLK